MEKSMVDSDTEKTPPTDALPGESSPAGGVPAGDTPSGKGAGPRGAGASSPYADAWNAQEPPSGRSSAAAGFNTREDRQKAASIVGGMIGAPHEFSEQTAGSGAPAGQNYYQGSSQAPHAAQGHTTVMCPLWQEMKKPWRKRHPVKFWLGVLVVFLGVIPGLVFAIGDKIIARDKVAVVNIEGIILDGSSVIKWIEEVHSDPQVKGVLVRVNSPGGAVTPSQEIYFALKRLSRVKPVVVSMGALAASGGYYVSLPAQRIFAAPSTVTGSIGVKMDLTNVEDLMDKLGITSTSLASGALKDAGSPFKPLKEEEREYFLGVVMDMYADFIDTVMAHRQLTKEQLDGFADGRALTGRQARSLGLVDQLGDRNDALTYLYKECKLDPVAARLVEGPEKNRSILERLTEATVNSLLSSGGAASGSPVFMYR